MQALDGKADISYIVLEVSESADEKLVRMVSIASRQEVTAHLQDGWYVLLLWHHLAYSLNHLGARCPDLSW